MTRVEKEKKRWRTYSEDVKRNNVRFLLEEAEYLNVPLFPAVFKLKNRYIEACRRKDQNEIETIVDDVLQRSEYVNELIEAVYAYFDEWDLP